MKGLEEVPESFESAMARLEEIVREMEAGTIPLEELVRKYEEGMRLVRFCRDKLAQAEQKIEILSRTTAETEPNREPS
jgi:exodeoxyribonuclease VII small subunit